MVFFSRGKGGGEENDMDLKEKDNNTFVSGRNGSPVAFTSTAANGDERQQLSLY